MGRDSILVVFDLDDTLIDTTGVLVPDALARVARAIGVDVGRLNPKGKKIDEVLAPLGEFTPEQREAAARIWYAPDVPPLDPVPGARELLESLRHATLVLLTRGDPPRQQAKIDACGLRDCFDEIVIRPIEGEGTKRDDLAALLERHAPEVCVVIGDDETDELRHAADLGCKTIKVPETPIPEIEAELKKGGA